MRERLRRVLDEGDVDAYMILNAPSPDPAFTWATGLTGHFEGCAAIVHDDGVEVVVPMLEEALAAEGEARVHVFRKRSERRDVLRDLIGNKRVGMDLDRLTVNARAKLEDEVMTRPIEDVSEAVQAARQVKDEAEVQRIRDACDLIQEILADLVKTIRPGQKEAEVAADLVRELLARDATPSFDPIIATGANAARPHHRASQALIEEGPLLIDAGARLAGYCSDITRTFHLGTEPSDRFRQHYEAVHEAMTLAIEACAPGVEAADVDAAARDHLEAEGLGDLFIHTTGHGLGVEVHDPGRLAEGSELVLEAGMVMTVEPGIYIQGEHGIRLEQDVLITPAGREVLTPDPLDLTVLPV